MITIREYGFSNPNKPGFEILFFEARETALSIFK
jgi:hypothetical protein